MRGRLLWLAGIVALVIPVASFLAFREWTLQGPLRRANRACDSGQWSLAVRVLGPVLGRHPDHAEARLLMARARLGLGDWQAGLEHLRLIPQVSPLRAEAKFYEGSALLEMDRGAQAERSLRECLALDAESVPARQKLVELCLWVERRAEARQLVWEIYERVPADRRAATLVQLLRVDFAEFPAELQMARLERFVALNPRDLDAVAALANLYDSAEESTHRERALPALLDALAKEPAHVGCLTALVQIQLKTDPDEAQRLLENWPTDRRDTAYITLLGIGQQEGPAEYDKAADCFRRVLEVQPENWKLRYRLATCLRALGETDQAERQLARQKRIAEALREDVIGPLLEQSDRQLGTAAFRLRVAELYETVGRLKEARCWYEEALRVQPSMSAAQLGLERLKGQPDVQPVEAP